MDQWKVEHPEEVGVAGKDFILFKGDNFLICIAIGNNKITWSMNARDHFYFRQFGVNGVGHSGSGGRELIIAVFSPDKGLVYTVDPISVLVKAVKAELMPDVKIDEECTEDTDCETHQVDKRKKLLSAQVAEEEQEVVFDHFCPICNIS